MSEQFKKADQKLHPVETEWHYPILNKYGFDTKDRVEKGLVRSYRYTHPEMDVTITCNTGVNSDHWTSSDGGSGYWSSLEPYLIKLTMN